MLGDVCHGPAWRLVKYSGMTLFCGTSLGQLPRSSIGLAAAKEDLFLRMTSRNILFVFGMLHWDPTARWLSGVYSPAN